MTRVYDDPSSFTEDMLEGFLDAYKGDVYGVKGGVVRATETPAGKVAVVVGGGSGHYPAFCGLVGPGLADGAVVGNIFTSPSAQDACTVARAVSSGAGVLFSTGNYAGDVMNFSLALEELRAEGIDARLVLVTDDIASASPTDTAKRRGIAGDFVVFKVAGAAAEAGSSLDEVERLALLANDRTRSFGVAFAGCTLPGATTPLFSLPRGQMGIGLGIHGEPGVRDTPLVPATELAQVLVDGILADIQITTNTRVGAVLNGLGATKYEELFVLWRTVGRLLHDKGIVVVDPEVGELVTSLDMAGCSLTLVVLDEELERLWRASAYTPAFRKTASSEGGDGSRWQTSLRTAAPYTYRESARAVQAGGDDAGRPNVADPCGEKVLVILEALAVSMLGAEQELGRLDAVAGDGDHGRGMVRGTSLAVAAARASLREDGGAGPALRAAGHNWAAGAGGTSGVLWGAALTSIGEHLEAADSILSAQDVADAVASGIAVLQATGSAGLGDKTMLDALIPFSRALQERLSGGDTLAPAWSAAADVAEIAAQSTAELVPRVGRARPLAERSVGTPDPGAISAALCLRAAAQVLLSDNALEA